MVLVCEAEEVTLSPRCSHHRIPVSVAPTQSEHVCVCVCVRVRIHDWLCVWVSYLDQIPSYTDECLFNCVEIHKQTKTSHKHTNENRNTHTHTHSGPRHQALHFLFHPLSSSSAPSYSTLASPTLKPTVTIATSDRATGSQGANHVVTTSVRKQRHTPSDIYTTAYTPSSPWTQVSYR